jgi:hypothetical protein
VNYLLALTIGEIGGKRLIEKKKGGKWLSSFLVMKFY